MKFANASIALLITVFSILSFYILPAETPEIDISPKLEWYAGHRYIKFYGGGGTTFSYSFVHDPDCPNKKCDK